MPKVQVLDINGQKVDEMQLSDAVFGIEPNKVLLHEMVVNYLANQRQGTQSALTRAEVAGGGKNLGDKKVLATLDKGRFELLNGDMVELFLHQNLAITVIL